MISSGGDLSVWDGANVLGHKRLGTFAPASGHGCVQAGDIDPNSDGEEVVVSTTAGKVVWFKLSDLTTPGLVLTGSDFDRANPAHFASDSAGVYEHRCNLSLGATWAMAAQPAQGGIPGKLQVVDRSGTWWEVDAQTGDPTWKRDTLGVTSLVPTSVPSLGTGTGGIDHLGWETMPLGAATLLISSPYVPDFRIPPPPYEADRWLPPTWWVPTGLSRAFVTAQAGHWLFASPGATYFDSGNNRMWAAWWQRYNTFYSLIQRVTYDLHDPGPATVHDIWGSTQGQLPGLIPPPKFPDTASGYLNPLRSEIGPVTPQNLQALKIAKVLKNRDVPQVVATTAGGRVILLDGNDGKILAESLDYGFGGLALAVADVYDNGNDGLSEILFAPLYSPIEHTGGKVRAYLHVLTSNAAGTGLEPVPASVPVRRRSEQRRFPRLRHLRPSGDRSSPGRALQRHCRHHAERRTRGVRADQRCHPRDADLSHYRRGLDRRLQLDRDRGLGWGFQARALPRRLVWHPEVQLPMKAQAFSLPRRGLLFVGSGLFLGLGLFLGAVVTRAPAQAPAHVSEGVVSWGERIVDGRLRGDTVVEVRAGSSHCVAKRVDGSWVAWGWNNVGQCDMPPPPPGRRYVEVETGSHHNLALRDDGEVVAWGWNTTGQCDVLALPANLTYVQAAGGFRHSVARRSDGTAVGWGANQYGQCTFPALGPGQRYVQVAAGSDYTLALRSDGNLLVLGDTRFGQGNVPQLPSGLVYVKIAAGNGHALALRSDGLVVAWGDNSNGQREVPALPPGLTYVDILAGAADHNVARRSDGAFVTWGRNYRGQRDVPALPPGLTYVQLDPGAEHTVGLRSDGSALAWGFNDRFQCNAPTPPAGLRYERIAAGTRHVLAQRSDGLVAAWGDNSRGQCNVPAGAFVELCAAESFSLGRRADGTLVGWGFNLSGQLTIPALPPGLRYEEVAAGAQHTVARRSDGAILAWGNLRGIWQPPPGLQYIQLASGIYDVIARRSDGSLEIVYGVGTTPTLPPGLRYVEIAAGDQHFLARRSDGAVVAWGDNTFGQCNVLPLPPGVSYVEITGGRRHSAARRSDGSVVVWGDTTYGQDRVPGLAPGTTLVQIAASGDYTIALFDSGGVNWFGPGCPGRLGVIELLPKTMPRFGSTLLMKLRPNPEAPALLLTGFSNSASALGPLPVDLSAVGMPGCALRVSPDLALPVTANGLASLAIPNDAALAGLLFHQQAFVLEPAANALGAVVSDAVSVVVGT